MNELKDTEKSNRLSKVEGGGEIYISETQDNLDL